MAGHETYRTELYIRPIARPNINTFHTLYSIVQFIYANVINRDFNIN